MLNVIWALLQMPKMDFLLKTIGVISRSSEGHSYGTPHCIKRSECYKVFSHIEPHVSPQPSDSSDDEDALWTQTLSPQTSKAPDIPDEISLPLNGALSEGLSLAHSNAGVPWNLPSSVTTQQCDTPGNVPRQLRCSSHCWHSPSYLSDYED